MKYYLTINPPKKSHLKWPYPKYKTRTTRTPAFWGYPPPPHDYPYHWVILDPKSKEDKAKVTYLKNSPKFQIFEFWNGHYTQHTFWSCLIRCTNMKWIRWVLLKIQSGHDPVHRRTDGQMDKVIPVYPPFNFVEAWCITSQHLIGIKYCSTHSCHCGGISSMRMVSTTRKHSPCNSRNIWPAVGYSYSMY